uniref:DDE_Tnp_1_7 domain-containing protein n=1 Tax=Heterorhabditis bacteriophora TaxID=37862 RepID=A0A1I7WJB0_HETBA
MNSIDFAIGSILEKKLSRTPHNNLDSFKVALVKSWDEISKDELRSIVDASTSLCDRNFKHQLNKINIWYLTYV